jgi:capsid protein
MAFQNRTLSLDHHRLRQGARLAMQDSPQGRAIVETKANAVAYTGLKLEPTPSAEILGITQEEAAAWAKNTSERFNLWANDKNAHRSEVMTFNQFQWLYAFWKERDNDIFTRLYYDNRSKDLQNPLQFESIDPDQVRGGAHTTGYGGFQPTDDGLIKDNRNRTTGFKVQVRELVSSQGGFNQYAYKQVTINKKSRSGRIFMLHGFKPEYAGQMRGFTKLAPILQDLEKATDFSLSHINYAISKSRLMAWVKPSEEEDAKPIMDQSETAFGQAPAADNFKSPSDDATEEEFLGEMKCYSTPENTYGEPVPVFVQNLLRGQDIKFAPDSAAAQQYAQFMESFLGDLSVVSGTPLEAVRMKVSSSFSAGNAMFLLFQRVIEIVRDDQVADCNGPVYEMWMSGEIAAGRITAPGFSDPRLRKAWLKSTWRGIPVPAIDPDKIAKANMKNIEMGTDSAESISQRTSGKSAIDNITSNNATYKDYEPPPFSEAAIAEEAAEGQETEED